jgi:molybdopterin biosynthesis enzyme
VALMPVADALAAILAGAEPLPEEMIALDDAWHRVLARDVAARRTQPPQAMSAMDGYAVRAADAADIGVRLKVIGEVAAGRPFERKVGAGEAVRIFTGGVIPDGADAVIIQGIRRPTAMASPLRKPPFPGGISGPPASISARAMCCSPAGGASPSAICRSPPA